MFAERGAVAVEWAAVACLGHAAIVEVIGGAALGAGGGALFAYGQICRGSVALGAAQVIGIVCAVAEVGLADDEAGEAEAEDAAIYLGSLVLN